jgi:hypothetical protein
VGNKRRADITDRSPINACEEGMVLDLGSAVPPQPYIGRRDEPSDQVLRLPTEVDVVWEIEVVFEIDDFAVRIVRRLGTEWRESGKGRTKPK